SPWNQLEAGILVSLGVPLIVLKEDGVGGGVLDAGAVDVFINRLPMGRWDQTTKEGLYGVFLKWQTAVRTLYYEGFKRSRNPGIATHVKVAILQQMKWNRAGTLTQLLHRPVLIVPKVALVSMEDMLYP